MTPEVIRMCSIVKFKLGGFSTPLSSIKWGAVHPDRK